MGNINQESGPARQQNDRPCANAVIAITNAQSIIIIYHHHLIVSTSSPWAFPGLNKYIFSDFSLVRLPMNSSPVSLLLLLFFSPRAPLGTVRVQFSDLDIAYYYYLNKVQLHSSKFDFAVGWCRTSFTSITSMPWWLLWSPPLQAGDWAYRAYFISWKFLSRRSVIQLDSSGEEEDTYNGEWEQGNNSEWLKRYLWTVYMKGSSGGIECI